MAIAKAIATTVHIRAQQVFIRLMPQSMRAGGTVAQVSIDSNSFGKITAKEIESPAVAAAVSQAVNSPVKVSDVKTESPTIGGGGGGGGGKPLSGGAIAGIVIGVVAFCAIVAVGVLLVVKRKRPAKEGLLTQPYVASP